MEFLNSFLNQISLYGFVALLHVAAWSDFKHFVIPNRLVLGVFLLFPAYAMTARQPVDWPVAFVIAGAVLAVGIVLFALKRIGGGDVKLMAATALWAGADYGIDFLLLTALAGGVLSVGLLLRLNYGWVIGWPAVDTRKAVPYGVAIATGGMYVAAKLLISANQV